MSSSDVWRPLVLFFMLSFLANGSPRLEWTNGLHWDGLRNGAEVTTWTIGTGGPQALRQRRSVERAAPPRPRDTSNIRHLGPQVKTCHHFPGFPGDLADESCPSTSCVRYFPDSTWLLTDPSPPRQDITHTINIDFLARRFPATIGVPSDWPLVRSNLDRNQENHLPDSLNALQPSPMGRAQR